jgi:ribosomal-protein-alanine N-acetyltransferase
MVYTIAPLIPENALEIITWRYDPPYDLYDLSREDITGLLLPENRYHAVLDEKSDLIGYCCFGKDAQVPGGDYSQGEPIILDIGVGLHPDYVGRGLGKDFVSAILVFAARTYAPKIYRVTVAAFNQRSLRVFRSLGFRQTHSFTRDLVELEFIQLER